MIAWLPVLAGAVAVKDVENVHLKDRTRYVTDQAGVLSATGRARADSILGDIWRQTGAEPVLVIIDSTDGEDVDEYATELFSHWGIGKSDRDNGLLILIVTDEHKNTFRTGYGVEGVLPDAATWRISTQYMNPRFKEGDFDGGVIAGLEKVRAAMTSPEARAELASAQRNDAGAGGDEADEFFDAYLIFGVVTAVAMLVLVLVLYLTTRGKPAVEAYTRLERFRLPMLIATIAFVGIPVPGFVLLLLIMRHLRLHKHPCPNCGTRMKRLDEETDNQYLTPSQDMEERLKSVDYDVWLCPNCGERDIIPYVSRMSGYRECPACGTRAEQYIGERVTRRPTAVRSGEAIAEYKCARCGNRRVVRKVLPAVPPVIIGGGSFGHGGGGGGGFSGGSFGGGMTGGGGSTSSW